MVRSLIPWQRVVAWRRRGAVALIVVAAPFAGGCSPPKVPVHVGVREVQTDVVIDRGDGAPAADAETTTTMP